MNPALGAVSWVTDLGWTLILSFFVTALIAAMYALMQATWPSTSPIVRYRLSGTVLLAMAISPLVVGWWIRTAEPLVTAQTTDPADGSQPGQIDNHGNDAQPGTGNGEGGGGHGKRPSQGLPTATAAITRAVVFAQPMLPLLVVGWAAYVLGQTGFLLAEYVRLRQRYLRHSRPVTPQQRATYERIASTMGLRQRPHWRESAVEPIPKVVGWRRPMVLFPASAIAPLSPEHLLLLVAHEVAHIRRRDVLVNYVQTAVETLLFYHRPVRRVSGQMRDDREMCCDDLAARSERERRLLAEALQTLEDMRGPRPRFVVAATGDVLCPRLRRLLSEDIRIDRRTRRKLLVVGAIIACLTLGALPTLDAARRSARPPEVTVDQTTYAFERISQRDGEYPTVEIPKAGHIAFRYRFPSPDAPLAFMIRPSQPGLVAVHVSSNEAIKPILFLEWAGPDGVVRSDTDGGSGRGGECFCMVPPEAKWVRCMVSSANQEAGGVLVALWQPRHPADCDADVIGRASSALQFDDFGRAQVPSRPNMRPPAIDYPEDIDTFGAYADDKGMLTFTAVGNSGALKPRLQLYDQDGKRVDNVRVETTDHVSRLSVRTVQHGGYYVAVMSRDRQSTGEYTLLVRWQRSGGEQTQRH